MKRLRHHSSGGILVVVLLLILVVGALTAGWLTIMTAEMSYTEQFSVASQRRIALGNATALARQYFLDNVLTRIGNTTDPPPANTTADVGGGWGFVSIPPSAVTALSAIDPSNGYNHFNPGNGAGYSVDVNVAMIVGEGTTAVNVSQLMQLKSRSSLLSGTVAVLNQPGNAVAGNVTCFGQALIWVPIGAFEMTASSFVVPAQPGWNMLPSNFPFPPLTGSEIGGVPAYNGSLNVIENTSAINSLAQMLITYAPSGVQEIKGDEVSNSNGATCDGAGNVTIDLREPLLGNIKITRAVTHLTLTGQATAADRATADNAAAILILVNQPATNLATVTCQNSNNRKLVLAIKNPTGGVAAFTFSQAGTGTWRNLITLENTPATFNFNGATQDIYGGIQTNRALTINNGALRIYSEVSPKLLERLADRDGWIEAFTQ